jgi:hypothetical protein
MVTITRHFHYKSTGHPVPSDLSALELRLDTTDFSGCRNPHALNQLGCADAPLAQHPDALYLHELRCYRVAHFMSMRSAEQDGMLDSHE